MYRWHFVLALVLALTTRTQAQEPAQASSKAAVEKELIALEEEFRQALIDVNISSLNNILDKDFIRVPPSGPNTTRAEWLKMLANREYQYLSFESKERQFHSHGDTMLVLSVTGIQTQRGETTSNIVLRLTHVWIKKDGLWMLAAVQGTEMPPQPAETQPAETRPAEK